MNCGNPVLWGANLYWATLLFRIAGFLLEPFYDTDLPWFVCSGAFGGPQFSVKSAVEAENVKPFVVMPHIAWVRRQRAGANPGGPPLLDLWLLCWSMAGGVSRGT